MSDTTMRGAVTARKIIADYLSLELPPLIDLARAKHQIPAHMLPYPQKYDAYDPNMLDTYPLVGSVVRTTSNWRRKDYDAYMAEEYDANYAMLVFVWAKTPYDAVAQKWIDPAYDSALIVRDELLALTRSCLLMKPSLNTGLQARVEENSFAETYLDGIKLGDGARWAAGGSITFDMQLRETNYGVPIGDANTITVDEALLPQE